MKKQDITNDIKKVKTEVTNEEKTLLAWAKKNKGWLIAVAAAFLFGLIL